jgi:hypothetical protein
MNNAFNLEEISAFRSDLAIQISAGIDILRKDIDGPEVGAKENMIALLVHVGLV